MPKVHIRAFFRTYSQDLPSYTALSLFGHVLPVTSAVNGLAFPVRTDCGLFSGSDISKWCG
jgi:hypothetical protein